ncbi:restriction endonuclease subunit S [Sphingobacterium lactis]|uniref:restriction endonuclease subunit S n=1 Tax=Sphingobacterium lactis TaxID=797291 RepID=UPI003DA3FAF7
MEWEKVKLAEVLEQVKDVVSLERENYYKLVTISNRGEIRLRSLIKGSEISSEKGFKCKKGCFIYSRLSVHNGALGIVPDFLEDAIITSEMPIFHVLDNVHPEYLLYYFKSYHFKIQIEDLTKGVGRVRVKEKDFLNIDIVLPKIEIQNKIVSELQRLNNDIKSIFTEITDQLDLIKNLRQAFLREAMQGVLVSNETSDGKTGTDLLAEIQAEKLQLVKQKKIKKPKPLAPITDEEIPFDIPENWTWSRLGNVVNMSRGRFSIRPRNDPRYFNGDYPFIQIGNLDEKGSVINEYHQTLNELGIKASKSFPKETIVIAIVGGTIGNLGVLGREMYFPDSIVGFIPNTNYNQKYLLNFLLLKQQYLKHQSYQMAGQPNIKIPTLEKLLFPLPPLEIQERILAKLDELMGYCDALEEQVKQSQQTNELLKQQVLREALGA